MRVVYAVLCKQHWSVVAASRDSSANQAPAAPAGCTAAVALRIYRPHLSSGAYRRHPATVLTDHPATVTTAVDCSRAVCIGGKCLWFYLTTPQLGTDNIEWLHDNVKGSEIKLLWLNLRV